MTIWTKEQIEAELKSGKRTLVLRGWDGRYRDLSPRALAKLPPGRYQITETTYEVIVGEKPLLEQKPVA